MLMGVNVLCACHTAEVDAIGWRPQVNLEEGLERTVQWYRQSQPARKIA